MTPLTVRTIAFLLLAATASTTTFAQTPRSRRAKPKHPSTAQSAASKKETSADARRRHEAAKREIRLTEEQIKENERKIKSELTALGAIQSDIAASRKRIGETAERVNRLDSKITILGDSLASNEASLSKLKDEYLKAVKKMRLARGGDSMLAFIFASDNFHQALRRMRYMRQFSDWKERQAQSIKMTASVLERQRGELSDTRGKHAAELASLRKEEKNLQERRAEQDEVVSKLKSNATALKSHLAKKQAEANSLKARIAELIAMEEAKAAEERRIAEEKRKAEEQRIAEEKRKAEEQRKAEEKPKAGGKPKADGKSKTEAKANPEGKQPKVEKADGGGKQGEKKGAGTDTDFARLKGSLPKPVSGPFKVTSRFGRQSLPDLPDVVFDNPGIDAETSEGASALAVCGGRVTGVYLLPGYNTVVIVSHGNHYTVYGNISAPAVKSGDTVKAGTRLGSLAPDEDNPGHSSIHFEVWQNREKLNPLEWISL